MKRNPAEKVTSDNQPDVRLGEILAALNRQKGQIFKLSFATAILALLGTFLIAERYTARAVLKPLDEQAPSFLPEGIGASFSGLLGGVLGSNSETSEIGQLLLESRSFNVEFINRHNLWVDWFASELNGPGKQLVPDPARYNPKSGKWLQRQFILFGPLVEGRPPKVDKAVEKFHEIFKTSYDAPSDSITIKATSTSPTAAHRWVNLLIKDLNDKIRVIRYDRAKSRTRFLMARLNDNLPAEVKAALSKELSQQIYIQASTADPNQQPFYTVEAPIVPDTKSWPKRGLIAIAAFVAALTLACFFVILNLTLRHHFDLAHSNVTRLKARPGIADRFAIKIRRWSLRLLPRRMRKSTAVGKNEPIPEGKASPGPKTSVKTAAKSNSVA